MRAWILLAVTTLAVFGCTDPFETPPEKVKRLLERGPNGLDCYNSIWSKEQAFEQPRPSIFDGQELHFDMDKILWKRSVDATLGTVRLNHAGYVFEFTVIGFGPDHYYEGYYCSKAAMPADKQPPPLGGMTNQGTAMDGEFLPF